MGKTTDHSGKEINGAEIIERVDDYISPGGFKQARYNCKCSICKNIFVADLSAQRRKVLPGCGCLVNENKKKKREYYIRDITNERFGRCVAKRRLEDGMWECLCDCGTTFVTSLSHLTTGHTKSCGCYSVAKTKERSMLNLTNQKYNKLTVIKYVYSRIFPSKASQAMWLCLCDCGTYTIVSSHAIVSGQTKSCGCLKASKRELEIRSWLNKHSINYTTEYGFDDLKLKGPLKYDFAILNDKYEIVCLIEHYGIQHYEDNSAIGFGKQQREITDKIKQDYCKDHGIKLYIISYTQDINKSLSKIVADMHVNTVLSTQVTA